MANPVDVAIDDAVEKIQATVAKSITTKLVPFLTLVLVPVAAWVQAQIGIDLDPAALAVFVGTAVLGIAGVAAAYVRSRVKGIYELQSALINQGIEVYKQGQKEYEKAQV